MDNYTATEQAYNNGYEAGLKYAEKDGMYFGKGYVEMMTSQEHRKVLSEVVSKIKNIKSNMNGFYVPKYYDHPIEELVFTETELNNAIASIINEIK